MIQLLFNNLIVFANNVSLRVLLQALVFLYDIPRPPWLEYHERCTAGILGLLPLVPNLSIHLNDTQNGKAREQWFFKHTRSILHGWDLPEDEERISNIDSQTSHIILKLRPRCLHTPVFYLVLWWYWNLYESTLVVASLASSPWGDHIELNSPMSWKDHHFQRVGGRQWQCSHKCYELEDQGIIQMNALWISTPSRFTLAIHRQSTMFSDSSSERMMNPSFSKMSRFY